ncbi:hypothetical protein BH23ACT5_BH23ACT5_24470 [soil metagenome]
MMWPVSIRVLVCAALVACSACTSDTQVTPETTAPDPIEEVDLAYDFTAGTSLTYRVEIEQQLVLETDGSSSAAAEEGIPVSANVTIEAVGTFTYTFSDGTDEATHTVDIDGQFDEVTVTGIIDGEDVDDPSDIAELGTIEPVAVTVVVDDRGRVVDDTTLPSDPMGFGMAPLSGLSGDLRRLPGPVLPEGPVSQGDTWTEAVEAPGMGDTPAMTTVTATLTGTEVVEGIESTVIESTTEVEEVVVDLSEFFAGFLGAFADPDDDAGEVDALIDQIEFRITMEPSTSIATAWLDSAGRIVRSTTDGPTALRMVVALPDEQSGEVENFELSLDVSQAIVYTLTEDGS